MTGEEIICNWMQPKPADRTDREEAATADWWILKDDGSHWRCRTLDLDALWEVEDRLKPEQRLEYWLELSKGGPPEIGYWRIIHATAAQKVKALAAVLRPEVERD